jgi:hypothetical protein
METLEKLFLSVIMLAIVAVIVGSTNTAGAIQNIGAAIGTLATNIVGVKQGK